MPLPPIQSATAGCKRALAPDRAKSGPLKPIVFEHLVVIAVQQGETRK